MLMINKEERVDFMRELQYMPAIKIFLHFRERFWERDGITGGSSLTDTAARSIWYPSHNQSSDPAATDGLLLAVYCVGDCELWQHELTTPEQRAAAVLDIVAQVHGAAVRDLYLGAHEVPWMTSDNMVGG